MTTCSMPNQYRFMGRAASSATSVQPNDGRVAFIFGVLERKGGIAKLMLCEQVRVPTEFRSRAWLDLVALAASRHQEDIQPV